MSLWLSRWRRTITSSAVFIVFAMLISQVGQGFARYRSGQVTYNYFADALSTGSAPFDYVMWREEHAIVGATFSPYDGEAIGARLSEGWRTFSLALQSGEIAPLSDVFSGPALSRAQAAVAQESGAQMVTLQLDAAPSFFHLDRILIQVRANSLIARFRISDQGLEDFSLSQDQTLTTLQGESTGWHIYAHTRESSRRLDRPGIAPVLMPTYKGLNYYPAASPWRAFWENFDPNIIAADMELIRDLGANSVRFFIPLEPFLVDPELRLSQLDTFAHLADQAGLALVPTLFDLKGSYAPPTWPQDSAHLVAVLKTLRAHDNIAFVDIKNEPDLDANHHDPALIEAWLRTMISLARHTTPELAYTIGWSTAKAVDLNDLVDVVTYHDYASISGTEDRLATIWTKATGKPVLITEIGQTSWRGLPLLAGSNPKRQAHDLQRRLAGLGHSKGVFVWTLHDFEDLDDQAIGGTFINRGRQKRFGLYDQNGAEKPAALVVREAFTPNP